MTAQLHTLDDESYQHRFGPMVGGHESPLTVGWEIRERGVAGWVLGHGYSSSPWRDHGGGFLGLQTTPVWPGPEFDQAQACVVAVQAVRWIQRLLNP